MQATTKRVVYSGSPLEPLFGHCRAVRKGPLVFVGGTTALIYDEEVQQPTEQPSGSALRIHCPGDAGGQAAIAMRRCIEALGALGGRTEDICRVKIFVANTADCEAVGLAFKEVIVNGCAAEEAGCAITILAGNTFADPSILVEVEIDAVVG